MAQIPYSVWRKKLERVYTDQLRDLIENRHIFAQANQVWKQYVGKRNGADLAHWMVQNYWAFAATAIRRIAEPRPRKPRNGQKTISLVILLEDLADNNKLLSREWYISQYRKGTIRDRFGNREFSSLAGSTSARYMPRRRIRSDIRHITRAARPMKLLTDKVIAHTEEDRRKAGRPTSAQIDKAVDVLVDIYKRYYSLLNASTLDTCRAAADVDVSGDLKKIWPE